MLSRYYPKAKVRKEKKLLGGEQETLAEEEPVRASSMSVCDPSITIENRNNQISSFRTGIKSVISLPKPENNANQILLQNLTLALISDPGVLPANQLPPPVAERKSLRHTH